jgi:hypothetical protein
MGLFSKPVSRHAIEGLPPILHRSMYLDVLYRTAIVRQDDMKPWQSSDHRKRRQFSGFRVFRPISTLRMCLPS